MRTKKEFEEERYFGLQKFNKPEEAFGVMEGIWGDYNADDSKNLHILTDETFEKVIASNALKLYLDYKEGNITEEKLNRAFGLDEDIDDSLFDFDFFLYSQKTNSYFTCRMSIKDDAVYMWNDRQWGYFEELWEAYSLKEVIKRTIKAAKEAGSEEKDFDRETIWDTLWSKELIY